MRDLRPMVQDSDQSESELRRGMFVLLQLAASKANQSFESKEQAAVAEHALKKAVDAASSYLFARRAKHMGEEKAALAEATADVYRRCRADRSLMQKELGKLVLNFKGLGLTQDDADRLVVDEQFIQDCRGPVEAAHRTVGRVVGSSYSSIRDTRRVVREAEPDNIAGRRQVIRYFFKLLGWDDEGIDSLGDRMYRPPWPLPANDPEPLDLDD